MSDPTDTPPATSLRRAAIRRAGFFIGLLLLAAAACAVWSNRTELAGAFENLADRGPLAALPLLVLPLVNWLLTSTALLVLTRRYGRVESGEMHALIGAAWLLNYLPLKPGLFGRVAYHKVVNGIAIRDSLKVLAQAIACGLAAVGVFVVVIGAASLGGVPSGPVAGREVLGALVGFGMLMWAFFAMFHRRPWQPLGPSAALLSALLLRLGDVSALALRFSFAFAVLGTQVSPAELLAIAAATQIASLLPVPFGIAEWAAGLVMAFTAWTGIAEVPSGGDAVMQGHVAKVLALGLSAGLLNRAAELCVALPVGLVSVWVIRRRMANLQEAPAKGQ